MKAQLAASGLSLHRVGTHHPALLSEQPFQASHAGVPQVGHLGQEERQLEPRA